MAKRARHSGASNPKGDVRGTRVRSIRRKTARGPKTETRQSALALVEAELRRIGFADIRKLFDAQGNLKPVDALDDDTAKAIAAIEVVTRRAPGGKDAVSHVHKVKLWNKPGVLAKLGQHYGLAEKQEGTGFPSETTAASQLEVARGIAFLLTKALRMMRPPGGDRD